MDLDQVLQTLQNDVTEAGGQLAWAEANGVTQGHVSGVLLRRWLPGRRILAALGLEKMETEYRRKMK